MDDEAGAVDGVGARVHLVAVEIHLHFGSMVLVSVRGGVQRRLRPWRSTHIPSHRAPTCLDEVGGRHLPVVEPEGVDQEVRLRAGHADGDVVDDLLSDSGVVCDGWRVSRMRALMVH